MDVVCGLRKKIFPAFKTSFLFPNLALEIPKEIPFND